MNDKLRRVPCIHYSLCCQIISNSHLCVAVSASLSLSDESLVQEHFSDSKLSLFESGSNSTQFADSSMSSVPPKQAANGSAPMQSNVLKDIRPSSVHRADFGGVTFPAPRSDSCSDFLIGTHVFQMEQRKICSDSVIGIQHYTFEL